MSDARQHRAVRVYQSAIEHHARGDLVDLGCGEVPRYAICRPLVSGVTCVDWSGSEHGSAPTAFWFSQPDPIGIVFGIYKSADPRRVF